MRRLLTLLLALMAVGAFAQSRVPYRHVIDTNAYVTVEPTNGLLSAKMAWVDSNWPTNINPALRYQTYSEWTNWLVTNSYLTEAYADTNYWSVTNHFLPGTNFYDGVLGTDDVWRIDWTGKTNVPEVLDYMVLRAGGVWWRTNSKVAVSKVIDTWTVDYESGSGYLSLSNGTTLYVPSNCLCVLHATGSALMRTTNSASVAVDFVKGLSGTNSAGWVAEVEQEADVDNTKVTQAFNGTVFHRPVINERQYQVRMRLSGFSDTTAVAVGGKMSQWHILLFAMER